MRSFFALALFIFLFSCRQSQKNTLPVIGFLDAFKDETIEQAKNGFYDALKENGFNEDSGTVKIIYRNAQGDIPTLTQAVDYFISEKVDLIATSPTLSTITAVQKTREIPVCMMVSPSPEQMNLTDTLGNPPKNLIGVYETLGYIDSSVSLIKKVLPEVKTIGTVFNQAEPQSQAAVAKVKLACVRMGLVLIVLPVNNSSETQLVVSQLLSRDIDAFFAMPDNTIFASFETILRSCNEKQVPVFTSEAGLVKRGAVAAYGADMYQWGYQAGQQAAQYLKNRNLNGLQTEIVKARHRIYNPEVAARFSLTFDSSFEAME